MKINSRPPAGCSNAKAKQISIKSLERDTLVIIRTTGQRAFTRRFKSIDDAIEFVLPRGNRRTELYLNGYSCVLNGWVS